MWKTVIESQLKGKELWDYVVENKRQTAEEILNNERAEHFIYVAMEPTQIAATGVCTSAYDL